MKLPAYPRYKPSGIEWLGDVPEHWQVTRFRFCVQASNAGEVIDRSYWHSGDELLFSCQRESMISDFPEFSWRKRTTLNDLLVTRNGTPYVHLPPANAIYSNVVQRCTLKDKLHRGFIALALETACERLRGDGYGVSIPSFSFEKWCDLQLPLPSLIEQRAIAAFLNRETGRVDRLVAKKRELIERLKEKRTALISRTVTCGLPPAAARAAGQPTNPPLKPSGLDWLDDVPAHWKVLPLKRVAQISYGVGGEIDRSLEEGLRTFSLPNINFEGALNLDEVPYAEVSEKEKRAVLLRKGDLLFNWRNGSSDHLGKTAYFDADGEYSHVSFLLRIRFKHEEHSSKFFRYLLSGYRVTGFFKHSKAGVNNTFNLSELSALPVMFPPLPEQAAIAAYLDLETAKLDALVGKVEAAVERLQEYRTALITAAVTGKIDVRGESHA